MTPTDIIPALEAQVRCYRRLAELAERQHEVVQLGKTEALIDVLEIRQGVLSEIARIQDVLGLRKARWSEYVSQLAAPDRERAEAALAQVRRLLEAITAGDHADALVLQQRKLNLRRPAHRVSGAGQVNSNYAAAAYSGPRSQMDVAR